MLPVVASIRKKTGSKFWFAAFTLPNGRRVQRSTKQTDRKRAQRIADQWEEVYHSRVAAKQSQKVISEIHKELTGESLPNQSVAGYFTTWMEAKKHETAPSTQVFYKAVKTAFLAFLEGRAEMDLVEVSGDDILAFRNALVGKVAPKTINHRLKVLRMIFGKARKEGLISENPAEQVKTVADRVADKRRGFTIEEIKAILGQCDDEWRSLVLFGLYTGQRLGDLSSLTWQNIDTKTGEIRLVTRKTGRTQLIPIADPLRLHIGTMEAGDDPKQPLHPRAFAQMKKHGRAASLSMDFYEIMTAAGIVKPRDHKKREGAGLREMSVITFHSLRHTATSLMKEAGVSAAVVQDLIGHDSAAISQHYTHINRDAKKTALDKLPSF